MTEPSFQRIARSVRDAILRGDYPAGTRLPRGDEMAASYGVSRGTIYAALRALTAEGMVRPVRRGGTIVLGGAERSLISRERGVLRDDRGYYFDPAATGWHAIRPPTITWGPVPADVAALLGVGAAECLIRDRAMGPPGATYAVQLATSYLPAALARGTVLAERDTGPGGIYDRLEQDLGHGPLAWSERVSSRMPEPAESADLAVPPGVPILRMLRITRSARPGHAVLECCDVRMRADLFGIGYRLPRARGAQMPARDS